MDKTQSLQIMYEPLVRFVSPLTQPEDQSLTQKEDCVCLGVTVHNMLGMYTGSYI